MLMNVLVVTLAMLLRTVVLLLLLLKLNGMHFNTNWLRVTLFKFRKCASYLCISDWRTNDHAYYIMNKMLNGV